MSNGPGLGAGCAAAATAVLIDAGVVDDAVGCAAAGATGGRATAGATGRAGGGLGAAATTGAGFATTAADVAGATAVSGFGSLLDCAGCSALVACACGGCSGREATSGGRVACCSEGWTSRGGAGSSWLRGARLEPKGSSGTEGSLVDGLSLTAAGFVDCSIVARPTNQISASVPHTATRARPRCERAARGGTDSELGFCAGVSSLLERPRLRAARRGRGSEAALAPSRLGLRPAAGCDTAGWDTAG